MAITESLLIGTIVVCFIKLYQLIKWRLKVNKMVEKMDGPKGLPILGHALEILKVENVLEYILEESAKYSSPGKAWFGPFFLLVHVDDPQNIKTILHADETLDKAEFYRFTRLEKTIFANPKETWKPQRKVLNTLRNSNIIRSYGPIINEKCKRLLKSLETELDGGDFDIFPYIGSYTLEIVFKIGFDIDINSLDDPKNNKIIHKLEK
jgi:cytochrome P450 family 4